MGWRSSLVLATQYDVLYSDEAGRRSGDGPLAFEDTFFAIGRMFCGCATLVAPPTRDKVMLIGLAREQKAQKVTDIKCRDLPHVHTLVQTKQDYALGGEYERAVAIYKNADTLFNHIKAHSRRDAMWSTVWR